MSNQFHKPIVAITGQSRLDYAVTALVKRLRTPLDARDLQIDPPTAAVLAAYTDLGDERGRAANEIERLTREVADLVEALSAAIRIANEAREEWDKAPNGMRAGKILIALSGGCPGYRQDIDAVLAVLARQAER